MSNCKRGDERIMRVTEVNRGQTTWVRVGDLVRCEDCANWNTMVPDGVRRRSGDFWCPVVRKCTRPTDWCCWGAREETNDGR